MVVLILSAVMFALILLTLVTSYYDPSVSWIFPVVGLITPAILLATFLLTLYWIIRWRWRFASLLFLPLLISLPRLSHYARLDTAKHYGELPRRGVVRVMSYNVRELVDDNGTVSTPFIADFIEDQRPDIVCLQEFNASRMKEADEPQLIRNYHRAHEKNLAIYSRYKIIETSENLVNSDFKSGNGFWADILIGEDTVRLYNIHLHSTTITRDDDAYLSNMEFVNDSLSEDALRSIIQRFRNSSIGRADQADSIAHSIAQTAHRVVVCGDFNDTPNSYTFRKISKGLQDSFQEVGVGYTHTFRGFLNLLRIDYILVEKPTKVLSYDVVDSISVSDHLPVITTLKL